MIWGEVVQEIRSFHLALLDHCPGLRRAHSPELTLDTSEFPFPQAGDGYDEWEPTPIPEPVAAWIEFHPVERALLEGPLLPIQEIRFESEARFQELTLALLELERRWITQATRAGETPSGWENELKSRLNRLQTRAGIRRLRQA